MQRNKKDKFDNEINFVIKAKRGGTRQGSGAKPKYNEPTKTIAFQLVKNIFTFIEK